MFAVEHRMHYSFDRMVRLRPHLIRLRPAPHCRTPILGYSLKIEPECHSIDWQQDAFGNHMARLVFEQPITGFKVDIELRAEMALSNTFNAAIEESAPYYPFKYDSGLQTGLAQYLQVTENGPLLNKWLQDLIGRCCGIIGFLAEIGRRVQTDIDYCVRMQSGVQSCEQTLQLRRGSCRDSAWLLVQILRHLGLAARFVSGYLLQPAADADAEDCVELHAWTEIYIPGPGWVGLDSTSGLFAGPGHIPLACAPEPLAAAPVTGTMGRCEVALDFHSTVTRIAK